MKKRIIYLVGASLLLLTGCAQYEEFLNQKSQPEEVIEVEKDVDIEMPANFEDIQSAYNSFEFLTLGDLIYQTDEMFQQTQPGFDVTVDELSLYEVKKADDSLERDFNYANTPSGLILAHVSIENTTSDAFYLAIDELTQSYVGADSFAIPSSNAYPLLHGNLRDILIERQGKIESGETVSGYLVYGLGKKSLEEVRSQGHFYLTITPPVLNEDGLGGEQENALGRSRKLFLPVDEQNETELKELQSFIPDRLTNEWWGDKKVIAQAHLNKTTRTADDEVDVTLVRAEISDFEPFPAYEESFKTFPNGQVIVTIEYEVTNHSTTALLPVDGIATLYIDEDPILSDYVLLNELYGLELAPGETMTFIKSFALDKLYYQQHWQNHPIEIEINLPTNASENMESLEDIEDNEEELEVDEVDLDNSYVVTFSWTPQLTLWINEDLGLEHRSRSDRSLIDHLESQLDESNSNEPLENEDIIEEDEE